MVARVAVPQRVQDAHCPECGRLLFKVRGGTLAGGDREMGLSWADPIEVQVKCRCRRIVAFGMDRPPRVVTR